MRGKPEEFLRNPLQLVIEQTNWHEGLERCLRPLDVGQAGLQASCEQDPTTTDQYCVPGQMVSKLLEFGGAAEVIQPMRSLVSPAQPQHQSPKLALSLPKKKPQITTQGLLSLFCWLAGWLACRVPVRPSHLTQGRKKFETRVSPSLSLFPLHHQPE